MESLNNLRIAVAVPCYRVKQHVLGVLAAIGPEVCQIYAVDDACPDGSGDFIEKNCHDPRVRVLRHENNLGVGAAVVSAYREAVKDGMDIVVKMDGDGQMNPDLLPLFVKPLAQNRADYTKGNRFYHPESLRGMPGVRLLGNAALSFMAKISCGYWNIMDPTNGYTAVRTCVLAEIPLEKLEKRYFFETDMLFRLNTIRAVVRDVPMNSVYSGEQSHLEISRVIPEFLQKHFLRLLKRYYYSYLLRDFNIGSLYSVCAVILLLSGGSFGAWHWLAHPVAAATSGTVMLAALPVMAGIQCMIAFLHYDVTSVPVEPIASTLEFSRSFRPARTQLPGS